MIGVLAISLNDATPARIAGKVQQRGVNAGVADGAGLGGDDGANPRDQVAVPGGTECDVGGKVG